MKWKVYGKWMGVGWRDEKPRQPRHNSLRFPLKPPLIEVADVNGSDYHFTFKNMNITDVCARTYIPDINLEALQIWLDHLGKAIYNPISAWQGPDGEIHVMADGDHRTRCLWEIGEPHVAVMLRKSPSYVCEGKEWHDWFRWAREIKDHNEYPPNLKREKGFNYYPAITPPPEVLQKYYDFQSHDGPYFKDTLDTTKTFREILFQPGHGRLYREAVVDRIIADAEIMDKTVLDVGCHFGYYSYLLLEAGAKQSTCVDVSDFKIRVVKTISARRQLHISAFQTQIQQFLTENSEKFDLCLFLNVFHHLLSRNKKDGWRTLNQLLDRCGRLYLMMGTTDPDWHVISEYGNDVDKAVSTMTGCHPKPLLKTGYRGRTLYVLSRNA